jgi:hypothetical protein
MRTCASCMHACKYVHGKAGAFFISLLHACMYCCSRPDISGGFEKHHFHNCQHLPVIFVYRNKANASEMLTESIRSTSISHWFRYSCAVVSAGLVYHENAGTSEKASSKNLGIHGGQAFERRFTFLQGNESSGKTWAEYTKYLHLLKLKSKYR